MYMAPGRLLSPIAAGGGAPGLDYNFLGYTADTLPSAITFSRASLAWQYDSSGTLATVPHNLLPESQSFESSTWSKTRSAVTGNTSATAAPDGTYSADKFTEQTDVATTRSMQNGISVVIGNTYTISVHAKAAERSAINLRFGSGFAAGNVTFDLSAGTLSSGGSVASSSITSLGSGWYRCFCAFVCTSSVTAGAQIFLSSGGTITYDGVSGNGVYLWGAQASQHTALRTYLTTSVKNLLGYSEQFDNAAWTKTLATVTANATTAPDGTTTADKLIEDTTVTAQHYARQAVAVVAGTTYTQSVYVKAAERFRFRMEMASAQFSANERAIYDVSTGTIASNTGGSPTITSVGNGWYRLSLTGTCTTSGSPTFVLMLMPNSGTNSTYTGDGASGIYIWGAMLASSGSLDTYSPNAAAAPSSAAYHGPALDYAYNGTAWVAQGLRIEEARTNLFAGDLTVTGTWPSISTTRASGATAPDGTTNGVTVTENASGTTSYGVNSSSVTVTASTATTGSIFAKAGTCTVLRVLVADTTAVGIAGHAYFDLAAGTVGTTAVFAGAATSVSATISPAGGGWYRCTVTATLSTSVTGVMLLRMTSANGTSTDAGGKTMSFWGPQIEANAGFASSPIITTTASATRAADVATIQPLGSWFNESEGTMMVETLIPNQTSFPSTPVSFGISSGSFNDVAYLSNSSTSDGFSVQSGGVQQAALPNSSPPLTVKKVAGAYKANDFAVCRNGGTVSTDASGAVPVAPVLARIGSAPWTSGNYLNGYVRKIRVYRTRLPNATLQVITS